MLASSLPIRTLLMLALGFLVSCQQDNLPTASKLRIIGGTEFDADHPTRYAEVALVRRTGAAYYYFCSGALINEKQILTAGHCVAHDTSEPTRIFATLKDRHSVTTASEELIAVRSIKLHDNYRFSDLSKLPQYDLAVINLAENAPASATAIAPLSQEWLSNHETLQDRSLMMVSHGPGSTKHWYDVGVRRFGYTKLNRFVQNEAGPLLITRSTYQFACDQDSGSPMYVQTQLDDDNSWRLIGLVSGANILDHVITETADQCNFKDSVYSAVPYYEDFLKSL